MRRFFFAGRRAVVFAGVYTIYMNWRLQFDGFCVKMYLWKKRLFHHGVLWLCILARLIFLQKFRKSRRQRQASCGCEKIRQKFAPAGKPGILYTRAEEEKFPQYIRRIRRRKNSFLCLNAAAACSGICVFPEKKFGIL